MAEAILNAKGAPKFKGYSAGSRPAGVVRAEALRQLEAAHIPTAKPAQQELGRILLPRRAAIPFCFHGFRQRACETCPRWPGEPLTAHWAIPDRAVVRATDRQLPRAFRDASFLLDRRITLFLNLPIAALKRLVLQQELEKDRKEVTLLVGRK